MKFFAASIQAVENYLVKNFEQQGQLASLLKQ